MNEHGSVSQALERRILHGVSCEWDELVWSLKPAYRAALRKPIFRLSNMKNRLGCWSLKKQEICLSRNLVFNHPWDSVRDVLFHEIAHQFTDQVLGAMHETSHGPSFQKACLILRADPKASGTYPTLHERLAHGYRDAEDALMLKIQKLMALAGSQNRHEAEAAMAKAHQLIARHNIDLITRRENDHYISIFLGKPALRRGREEYTLSRLLIEYYFVEGIWVPAYVLEKAKMGRVLEISGTVSNVKIAEYIHDYILHFIDSQWEHYQRKKQKKLKHHRKTDFAIGIIEGFESKLKQSCQKKSSSIPDSALIKIEDTGLKEYIRYRYRRLSKFSRSSANTDYRVVADGMEIGKKLVISKGITEKKTDSHLQLPE